MRIREQLERIWNIHNPCISLRNFFPFVHIRYIYIVFHPASSFPVSGRRRRVYIPSLLYTYLLPRPSRVFGGDVTVIYWLVYQGGAHSPDSSTVLSSSISPGVPVTTVTDPVLSASAQSAKAILRYIAPIADPPTHPTTASTAPSNTLI